MATNTESRPSTGTTQGYGSPEDNAKQLADVMIWSVRNDPSFHIYKALKNKADQGSDEAIFLLEQHQAGKPLITNVPVEGSEHFNNLRNAVSSQRQMLDETLTSSGSPNRGGGSGR